MDSTLGVYLIKRDPEDASYDEAWGFVVAALDEETARTLPGDEPQILLRDFHAG